MTLRDAINAAVTRHISVAHEDILLRASSAIGDAVPISGRIKTRAWVSWPTLTTIAGPETELVARMTP